MNEVRTLEYFLTFFILYLTAGRLIFGRVLGSFRRVLISYILHVHYYYSNYYHCSIPGTSNKEI